MHRERSRELDLLTRRTLPYLPSRTLSQASSQPRSTCLCFSTCRLEHTWQFWFRNRDSFRRAMYKHNLFALGECHLSLIVRVWSITKGWTQNGVLITENYD